MARNREDELDLCIDKVLMANYVENDDSFLFRGRNDGTWKLFYLESGTLTADMGDGPWIVRGGHAVFCGPGDFYTIGAYDRPSSLLVLSFECSDAALPMLRNKMVSISATMRASLRNTLLGIKRNDSSHVDIAPLLA